MQTALGGRDKLSSVIDIEQRLEADTWDHRGRHIGHVVKRIRWISPGHLRMDQIGPGDSFVLYFDGMTGWEILPGGKAAIPLRDGELRFAQQQHRSFPLSLWLADRDPRFAVTSPTANVLRIAERAHPDDPVHQVDLTIDPQSGLPVAERTLSLAAPDRPSWFETRLSDWTSVDGVRFPRRNEVLFNGTRLAAITVTSVVLNSGLSISDLATKPLNLIPAVKP
jgi:hypothetical protein